MVDLEILLAASVAVNMLAVTGLGYWFYKELRRFHELTYDLIKGRYDELRDEMDLMQGAILELGGYFEKASEKPKRGRPTKASLENAVKFRRDM